MRLYGAGFCIIGDNLTLTKTKGGVKVHAELIAGKRRSEFGVPGAPCECGPGATEPQDVIMGCSPGGNGPVY